MIRLTDERTRFWKKYLRQRERLEYLSSKHNQIHIHYRLSPDVAPYHLETIEYQSDASFDLMTNVHQAMTTLLIDSEMTHLHPLLTVYQIAMETHSKTVELASYLAKLLTSKYHLRLAHQTAITNDPTIPFRLTLTENSLKNGLCTVWNRDTRLHEEMHVKQVAHRLANHFQALADAL
jgi:hypothetical protein